MNDLAITLHATAIYLLRAVRVEDPATGLSPARLSALSVIVYAGPLTLSALAEEEQATLPGMSQLVAALEREGLVRRWRDPEDGRRWLIEATKQGTQRLHDARRRRLRRLEDMLARMSPGDRKKLAEGLLGLTRAFAGREVK